MKRLIAAVVALSVAAAAANGYVKMTGLKEAVRSWLDRSKELASSYTGEVSDESWGGDFTYDSMVTVKKDKDKDFVILNLTDTHFGDYDYRRFTALGVIFTAKQLVRKIKPDLITVSGDIVCTDSTVYSVKRFTDLMESFGVPWAPIFGNHDDEGNCDLNYLADVMLRSPHCILRKGPASMGVGNYVIGITEEDGSGGEKLAEALVMMDSHHSACTEEQVEWFAWAAQGINTLSGGKAEIMTMMHIPLAQYQFGCDEKWDSTKKEWKPESGAVGTYGEKICCARDADGNPLDNGLFAEIKKAGGKYVFCGHEHLNNFSFVCDGVRLTYMMKIGKGSGFSPRLNGGTKIVVGSDGILRFSDESILRTVLSVDDPLNERRTFKSSDWDKRRLKMNSLKKARRRNSTYPPCRSDSAAHHRVLQRSVCCQTDFRKRLPGVLWEMQKNPSDEDASAVAEMCRVWQNRQNAERKRSIYADTKRREKRYTADS